MTARRRSTPPPAPPSTVLRWRLLLQTGLLLVFGAFLAVASVAGSGFEIAVAIFGILAAIGGAIDAVQGHRQETSLLRRIAHEAYRASYAEAELARVRRLRTNQGPM